MTGTACAQRPALSSARRRGLLALALLAISSAQAAAPERAFWVWNRAEPLTPPERDALRAAGVDRLYWQAGELELRGRDLVFRRTAALANDPAGPQLIPVVRVSTAIRSPEQWTGEAFGQALRPIADAAPGREVQIDFDCPDRLLPVYAARLADARRIADIRRLTITALAGWANAPARDALWPAVDAVFPMLYDTAADSPAPGATFQPRPLLDPSALKASLQSWSRCPVPWYAGLPAFARVTLFDSHGRSRGHLRGWDWEDLVFNPSLLLDRPAAGGTTVLRAAKATRIGESPASAGEYAALRGVDRVALRQGAADALAAGARGVTLFRLPDPTGSGGWSLPQLLALLSPAPANAVPRLSLHAVGDGRWRLRNDSETDLPPRFAAPDRGYGLELELANGAIGWREALPGDFHRVASHVVSPTQRPVPTAIPLARRLTFWFAELPAHGALTTGLVQLAPGPEPSAIRFRLPNVDQPENTPWQTPE